MDLYLIRHAQAVDGELGTRDGDRALTAHGRRQALDVGNALARHGVRFSRMVTSPLVRAVETAELVAVCTGFDGGLDVTDAMAPDGHWKHLAREVLEGMAGEASLALVGHEPSIGHYLSKLVGQKGMTMQKGAVARLDFKSPDEPARLVWTLSPKSLTPTPG
jgi:phosphohistidine phosphatase